MAERKPLFMDQTEGYWEEMATTDTATFGGLTLGGDIDMNSAGKITNSNPATTAGDALIYGQTSWSLGTGSMTGDLAMGTNKITGLGAGTAGTDAVNKEQLDQAVISGGTVKELLWDQTQLDDTDGINALEILFFANQPASGDTISLKNGTLTRTYTFVANQGAESAATDVSIETDAATAMERFATRVNADAANTQWDLVFRATEHSDVNVPGTISVIERASAVGDSSSRIYGTFTTPADAQVIEFAASGTVDLDYSDETPVNMPAADPAEGRFGLRRTVANLTNGEIHFVTTNDSQYAWDDDVPTWQILSGPASIPDATAASGGGIKGKASYDSDKGLDVSSGVVEAKIDAVTIDFNGSGQMVVTGVPDQFEVNGTATNSTVDAAALNTLTGGSNADSEHTHAHSAITGQGEDDHHNRLHALDSVTDHSASGLTAGEVLRATGATTFAWSQLGHGDLGGIGENDHHNRSHAITSVSDHTESGLTTGHVLTATGASSFAWQAPPPTEEAKGIEGDYSTAVDTTANGDPVYWNGNDTLGRARADTTAKARVVGVIESGGGAAPTSISMVSHGKATSILSGATANTPYYLQASGGIGTSLPGGNNRVIQVGTAMNTTDLWVKIIDYGKKAA